MRNARKAAGWSASAGRRAKLAGVLCFWTALALNAPPSGFAQQTTAPKPPKPPAPAPAAVATGEEPDQPVPGDWAPSLLYDILSSSNEEAQFDLVRAAFAAGPAIVPRLDDALKDDRTAEFAAQSLAYIGGERAFPVLWKLLSDPRDLNLRRFTYGALGEYDSPEATKALLEAIEKSDSEPDRTVTETAVIALTVRTDTTLPPRLLAMEKKLQDVVIRDDLDNARAIISERAKFMTSPLGKKAGGSIESAVRTYFLPALEPPSEPDPPETIPVKPGVGKVPAGPAPKPPRPQINVEVRSITFSPDQGRALARVIFEDPTAVAYYDFVLQKRFGEWTLASVWLGQEMEKPGVGSKPAEPVNPDSETETPK